MGKFLWGMLYLPYDQGEVSVIFSRELPKYLTRSEVQEVLRMAEHPRDHLLVNLLWQTGCRISEILEIRVGDIDFYGKTLRVRSLKQKVKESSWRVIPLKGEILGELGGVYITGGVEEGGEAFFDYKAEGLPDDCFSLWKGRDR